MRKPFPVEIFERFLSGESVRELAERSGIPADRIEQRLRAAAIYLNARHNSDVIVLPARYREHYGRPN